MKWNRPMLAVVVLSLALTACSPGEEVAEQLLESEGLDDVEIDSESGEVRVEGEGEDGGSFSIGGGEVPDGFPIDIANGGEIQSVVDTEGESMVGVQYDGGFDELKRFYEDWSSSNGEVTHRSESTEPPSATWLVEDGDHSYSISVFFADPFVQVMLIVQDRS